MTATAPSQSSDIVQFAAAVLGVTLYPGQAESLLAFYDSLLGNWLLLCGRREKVGGSRTIRS